MLTPKTIGRALKSARTFLDLHRDDVAEQAGLTLSQLTRLEQGRTAAPSVVDVYALCEVLGVTLDDIVEWAQDPEEEE